MKCKNCGHNIILEREGWKHYPVEGDLDFCKYFDDTCDCGCTKPEPKDSEIKKEEAKK